MAFTVMQVILFLLVALAVIGFIIMFSANSRTLSRVIIAIMGCYGAIVSIVGFISLPANFLLGKIFAVLFVVLAFLGVYLRFKFKYYHDLAKILVSISVVGGIIVMFS